MHDENMLSAIKLLAMDVDGVLTDGTLGLDNTGNEQKRFHVADGLGLVVMRQCGIQVAWISGRANAAVEQRARELQVSFVLLGIRDKGQALKDLASNIPLDKSEIAYIGDDWNDFLAFNEAGVAIAVANAAPELKQRAHIVTQERGGNGAVREICDAILRIRGETELAMRRYVRTLEDKAESPGAAQ